MKCKCSSWAIVLAILAASTTGMAQGGFGPNGWVANPGLALPVATGAAGSATDAQGHVYVIGGLIANGSGNTTVSTVWRLDPALGLWTQLAGLNVPRHSFAVATDALGRVYAIAGQNSSGLLASVERYDPATNTWSFVAPLPVALVHCEAAATPAGDAFLVAGGVDNAVTGLAVATVYKYDVASDSWSTQPSMTLPRTFFGLAMDGSGRAYAVGGADGTGFPDPTSTTVERRDPVTGQWTQLPPLIAHPHNVGGAVADANGFIYAVGGWDGTFGPVSAAVERYDPDLATWQVCDSLNQAKNNLGIVRVPSGQLYVTGGGGVGTYTAMVEVATPFPPMTPTLVATTGPGGAGMTISVSNLPPLATEGWTLLSFTPAPEGVGTGPLFGLQPDSLTMALINMPVTTPPNIFHYDLTQSGAINYYPNVAWVAPWIGPQLGLAGLVMDVAAVLLTPFPPAIDASNVVRLTM